MAEPARRLEDDRSEARPRLRAVKEGDTAESLAEEFGADSQQSTGRPQLTVIQGGGQESRIERLSSFGRRNKKGLKIAGIGSGIAALLVAVFFALLPLKIEHMMKNIFSKRFSPIERAYERRGIRLVLKHLVENRTGKEINSVATGRPSRDLFRTWRLSKFEDKLFKNHGIKIENPNSGTIRITAGGVTNNVEGGSPDELLKKLEGYLDRDLKGRDAKRALRIATREETHFLQIMKRRNLRLSQRNAFKIRKWHVFSKKTGPDAKKNLDTELKTETLRPIKENLPKWLGCLMGSSADCPNNKKNTRGAADGSSEEVKKALEAEKNKIDEGGLREATETALDETIADGDAPGDLVPDNDKVGKSLTGRFSKFMQKYATRIVVSAGIITAIDTLARIDATIADGGLDDVIEEKNKLQYASVFAEWLKISDQMKAGEASGDEVAAAMEKLDGIEKAAAYNAVMNDKPGGQNLGNDKRVRSNWAQDYKNVPIVGNVIHPLLSAYNTTLGKVFRVIGDLVGEVLGFVTKLVIELLGPIGRTAEQLLGKAMEWALGFAVGPVVDGSETGPDLINAIDAGGDVTANQFAKDSGGRELSAAETREIHRIIAMENRQENRGLYYVLFSPDNPRSMLAKISLQIPATPKGAAEKVSGSLLAFIRQPLLAVSTPIGAMFSPVYADNHLDLYGVQQYGFTDADLEGDSVLPDSGDPADCADLNQSVSLCVLDLAVISTLQSHFTNEDDGGLGTAPTIAPPTETAPVGTSKELAQQILDSPNISFTTNLARQAMENAAKGQESRIDCQKHGGGSAPISENLLGPLLAASKKYKIGIGYLTNNCHSSPRSLHYKGRAVDINTLNGVQSDGKTQLDTDFVNELINYLPKGSRIGPSDCLRNINTQGKVTLISDKCNHLHVDVP